MKRAGALRNVAAKDEAREGDFHGSKLEPVTGYEPKQVSMTDFAVETGLLPEGYIVQVLEAHGGELRQQELIAETGWSRSTVSRLLTKMELRGEIVRVRLGAENVVYLPGSVPTLARQSELYAAVTA